MAYCDFTLESVTTTFGLSIGDAADLFASVEELAPSNWLARTLEAAHLARAMNTEKARSELMIAPFFTELWLRFRDQCSFFSGIDFTVDAARGLKGFCDFILSRSPTPYVLSAPVAMITESKNSDLPSGYGQCVAGMIGAKIFNEQRGSVTPVVFGAVSTGDLWAFLSLNGTSLTLDRRLYDIHESGKILGVLYSMLA